MKQLDEYSDPKQVASDDLKKMGNLAKGLGKSYLKELDTSAVAASLGEGGISEVEFQKSEVNLLQIQISPC